MVRIPGATNQSGHHQGKSTTNSTRSVRAGTSAILVDPSQFLHFGGGLGAAIALEIEVRALHRPQRTQVGAVPLPAIQDNSSETQI